jgi:peptidoglycan/xylan/chitin deacetylase (PgdA/CDA1 family)
MSFKLPNTIINFHVIQDIDWMEQIIVLLKKHYYMVTAKDLENFYYGNLNLKHACHITVDDGDQTVYEHLFPLLMKHKIPISIYVSPYSIKTGKNFWFQEMKAMDFKLVLDFYNEKFQTRLDYVNDRQVKAILKSLKVKEINSLIDNYKKTLNQPYLDRIGMNIDQILELKDSGFVEIGAHTLSHPILKNEDEDVSRNEIKNSVDELSDILGYQVKYFAYPNGLPGVDFTDREVKILKENGIKLAFSTENKRFSNKDNPLSIPRNGLTKGSKNFVLAKLIFGNSWVQLRRMIKGKQESDYREF